MPGDGIMSTLAAPDSTVADDTLAVTTITEVSAADIAGYRAVTRSLLMYRYRRQSEARVAAASAGYEGFMFPWQSGSLGTEQTQELHLNPMSGRWDIDLSHNQRHVSAAIFYNVWQYVTLTEDTMFLEFRGAEMMLGIARFWSSIAHYSPERQRYEIHGVMGPD